MQETQEQDILAEQVIKILKKPEVASAIREAIQADGAETEETADKQAGVIFDKWRDNAISAPRSGLLVAPEDYFELFPDGTRKKYFTWHEAMKIEEEVLKPNGWRLPTCQDWCLLHAEFGIDPEDGSDDAWRFMRKLSLYMNGYKEDGDIYEHGSDGYFWSSTDSTASFARRLYFASNIFAPQDSSKKANGFSIRCVADKGGEE